MIQFGSPVQFRKEAYRFRSYVGLDGFSKNQKSKGIKMKIHHLSDEPDYLFVTSTLSPCRYCLAKFNRVQGTITVAPQLAYSRDLLNAIETGPVECSDAVEASRHMGLIIAGIEAAEGAKADREAKAQEQWDFLTASYLRGSEDSE